MKECTKCGIEFPIEMFDKNKKCKDGHRSSCKNCQKLYRQNNKEMLAKKKLKYKGKYAEKDLEYRTAHKSEIAAKNKIFRENNKEKFQARNKKYYEENKNNPGFRERRKSYGENHFEEIKAKRVDYFKIYNKKNQFRRNIMSQKYRTKKLNLPSTLTVEQWEMIKSNFNNTCCYCGQAKPLQQEHFKALSNEGEYTINNIVPACKSCNCSKGAKDFFEWYPSNKNYNNKREKNVLKFLGYTDKAQQLKIC